jgi:hypothetical protein
LLTLFVFTAAPLTAVSSLLAAHNPPLTTSDLWIDLLIGPPLVPLFNDTARANDIARVDHHSQIAQLAGITHGQKIVVFKSAAEAEQLLPGIADQIDIVGYNFEHGPGTPPDEQADPVDSIQRMRALADTHGLGLALGPDYRFANSHGPAMAPYVDIFVLQIQREQTNPTVVIDFIAPLVPQLRAANPALQVSAQVRTEGDMAAIVQLLDRLLPYLDGVSILTSPQTVPIAEELIFRLRRARTAVYLPLIR